VPTAQRYEPGVLNIAGIYGMQAAIAMFLRHGTAKIAGRLLELTTHLTAGLRERGYKIHSPSEGAAASGITTFRREGRSMAELHAKLEKAGVVSSLRHDREGRDYLRFSPHFYNTEAELDTALALL
jgi:selenocysteine lyase/cysteine desulfurase